MLGFIRRWSDTHTVTHFGTVMMMTQSNVSDMVTKIEFTSRFRRFALTQHKHTSQNTKTNTHKTNKQNDKQSMRKSNRNIKSKWNFLHPIMI